MNRLCALLLALAAAGPAGAEAKEAGLSDLVGHVQMREEAPLRQLSDRKAVLRLRAKLMFPVHGDQVIFSAAFPGAEGFKAQCLVGYHLVYDEGPEYYLIYPKTSTEYKALDEAGRRKHLEDRDRFYCTATLDAPLATDSNLILPADSRFIIDKVSLPADDASRVDMTFILPEPPKDGKYHQEDIAKIKRLSCRAAGGVSAKTISIGKFQNEFFPIPEQGNACPDQPLFDLWVPKPLEIKTNLP